MGTKDIENEPAYVRPSQYGRESTDTRLLKEILIEIKKIKNGKE